jgi:RNA polymerase sigma factor (sigma-70 family)
MAGAELEEIETVYRTHFRAFARVATAILGDPDVAHDAVQDAFATAVRKRTRFRGEAPLEAWLWRIVLNKSRDQRRHERLFASSSEAAVSPNGHEADAAVRTVLAALPNRQREVIFLRYYADLDYRRIAELLGISEGTVAATLSAARSTLGERLREGAHD